MARSVVVTGANSGIGLATALELAAAGYDVIGTVRGADKEQTLLAAAAGKGVAVRTVEIDVASAKSTRHGFAVIEQLTEGGPWAVVNNAGFAQSGAIEDVTDAQARYQLEVNLLAPMRFARLALPGMRARGDGRIVNVSSIAGRVASPMTGWYCASKFGLEAASDALRVEVAPFGVKVILIEPGGFGTGIWAEGQTRLPSHEDTSPYREAYRRAHAATGRAQALLPHPVWVARAIRLALASPFPLARYLVGVDAVAAWLAEMASPTVLSDMVKAFSSGVRGLPRLPGR